MLRILVWIIFFVIFCGTVSLTVPNAHSVVLYYYVGSLEINLAVLLFLMLCLGVTLGVIFNLIWVWNLYNDNQRLKKLYKQALRDNEALLTHSQQRIHDA